MKSASAQLIEHLNQEVTTRIAMVKLTLTKYPNRVVSISQANPGVVLCRWDHDLETGDVVRLFNVRGMTPVNRQEYQITKIDSRHFSIDVDTSQYPAYTHKGVIQKVIGYTAHYKDLVFEKVTYRSTIGYTPDSVNAGSDMAVNAIDHRGVMQNAAKNEIAGIVFDGITDEDLVAGFYDNAKVAIFAVNYDDLTMGRINYPVSGYLSEVTLHRGSYQAELVGLTARLQEQLQEVYSANCRADLGDDYDGSEPEHELQPGFGCKVRVDPPFWQGSQLLPITDVDQGAQTFTVAGNGRETASLIVQDSTGNDDTYTVNTRSYDSGLDETTYTVVEAIPDATADGSVLIERSYAVREAGDAGLGDVVKPTDESLGRQFKCVSAGVAGTSEPAWDTAIGALTTDGTVQWETIEALTKVGVVHTVIDRRRWIDEDRYEAPIAGIGGVSTLFPIIGVNQGSKTFTIAGNLAEQFPVQSRFSLVNSPGNDGTYRITAVSQASDQTQITVAESIPDSSTGGSVVGRLPSLLGFFTFGKVTFLDGKNKGISREVRSFSVSTDDGITFAAPGLFEVFEQFPFDIEVGDKYEAQAGCDKSLKICVERFDNIHNRRAEDNIPGMDKALLYPDAK